MRWMILNFSIVVIFFAQVTMAFDSTYFEMVAGEHFKKGNYAKAINSAKEGLSSFPDSKKLKDIKRKSEAKIAKPDYNFPVQLFSIINSTGVIQSRHFIGRLLI
jgi:hypothetical protein